MSFKKDINNKINENNENNENLEQDNKFETCMICMDVLGSENIINLKCNHVFHKDCLLKSINTSKVYQCPYCRRTIDKKLIYFSENNESNNINYYCKGITQKGENCKKSAYKNGFCTLHYKKLNIKNKHSIVIKKTILNNIETNLNNVENNIKTSIENNLNNVDYNIENNLNNLNNIDNNLNNIENNLNNIENNIINNQNLNLLNTGVNK